MSTLAENIKINTDWIIRCFASDQMALDYTIDSFIQIDKFFAEETRRGKAIPGGRLDNKLGPILFSIGAYVGETFIKNVPGTTWITDDKDRMGEVTITIRFPNNMHCRPVERMINRLQNGPEDGIYPYGHHLTKEFLHQPFNQSYWDIHKLADENELKYS